MSENEGVDRYGRWWVPLSAYDQAPMEGVAVYEEWAKQIMDYLWSQKRLPTERMAAVGSYRGGFQTPIQPLGVAPEIITELTNSTAHAVILARDYAAHHGFMETGFLRVSANPDAAGRFFVMDVDVFIPAPNGRFPDEWWF